MIDLELHSVLATPKQHTLFIKRLRAEFRRPGSRGVRDSQDGFLYAPPPSLKDMEAELARDYKESDYLHHLEIQPDDDLPTSSDYMYDLSDLVNDTMESLRLLRSWPIYTWVAVPHPTHGMFSHAHVFATGPQLEDEHLATMRAAAEQSWDKAVKGCAEAKADRAAFHASIRFRLKNKELKAKQASN